ncbi:hypothetical protein T492DRAFT_865396 [Pavlovales sp. CCMP2436]|nr:hypothetical protein T492DRAFT_865396 [Pavlovales sp. CCMP2436]
MDEIFRLQRELAELSESNIIEIVTKLIQRLQRFVFGFLIIHHFYQLPTAA